MSSSSKKCNGLRSYRLETQTQTVYSHFVAMRQQSQIIDKKTPRENNDGQIGSQSNLGRSVKSVLLMQQRVAFREKAYISHAIRC